MGGEDEVGGSGPVGGYVTRAELLLHLKIVEQNADLRHRDMQNQVSELTRSVERAASEILATASALEKRNEYFEEKIDRSIERFEVTISGNYNKISDRMHSSELSFTEKLHGNRTFLFWSMVALLVAALSVIIATNAFVLEAAKP